MLFRPCFCALSPLFQSAMTTKSGSCSATATADGCWADLCSNKVKLTKGFAEADVLNEIAYHRGDISRRYYWTMKDKEDDQLLGSFHLYMSLNMATYKDLPFHKSWVSWVVARQVPSWKKLAGTVEKKN